MNKLESEQIDIILESLLTFKTDRIGVIDVDELHKNNDNLKHLSIEKIRELLYLIRLKQSEYPTFFVGDLYLRVNKQAIIDFLKYGGFKKIYIDSEKLKRKKNFRFWVVLIISIITLVILIYTSFFNKMEKSIVQQESPIKKELLQKQITLPTDSTKYPYQKANNQKE